MAEFADEKGCGGCGRALELCLLWEVQFSEEHFPQMTEPAWSFG